MEVLENVERIVILNGEFEGIEASKDVLLACEYGKTLNNNLLIEELMKAFKSTVITHLSVSLSNYKVLITPYISSSTIFLNLCDGTEVDGYPGNSVVKYLESQSAFFTGSGSKFYEISTSKPVLKTLLQKHSVKTAEFELINYNSIPSKIGYPLIVKPSVSYGSINISTSSICSTPQELSNYLSSTPMTQELFVESFLSGREYTVLVTSSKVYTPAERVFDKNIPIMERILTFDICWSGCDLDNNNDGQVPDQPYSYHSAPIELHEILKNLARDAFNAVGGDGYGRVDIRQKTQDLGSDCLVLEVNANCGLAFGSMASSLGEILILSKVSPAQFLSEICHFALQRYS